MSDDIYITRITANAKAQTAAVSGETDRFVAHITVEWRASTPDVDVTVVDACVEAAGALLGQLQRSSLPLD